MEKLSIVHLSDLHLGMQNEMAVNTVLGSLLKDIRTRIIEWKLDNPVVAITGDLTYHGRREEFSMVDDFLAELRDELQPKAVVFCPGNHDLNWELHSRGNSDLMEDLVERGDRAIDRIEKRFEKEHDRNELRVGMSNYYEFLDRNKQPHSDFLFSIGTSAIERFKVNFISFNSAYLFSNRFNYYGYVGRPQIETATDTANQPGEFPKDYRVFNIALIHHPFEAIVPASQLETEDLVRSRCDIILNGHVHNLRVYVDLTASLVGSMNTRSHPVFSGARCIYDELRDPHVVPGYSFIDLTFDRDQINRIGIYEIHYDKIKQAWLADPNNPNIDLPIPIVPRPPPALDRIAELSVADLNNAISWGWNGEKLVKELMKIDAECIEGLAEEDEGTVSQWAPIRVEHPDTWRLIIDKPGSLIGYWSFVPLFGPDAELAKAGKLIEGQITADRIPEFELPGHYALYFVSMVLKPEFRRSEAIHMLYHSFLKVMEQLAEHGVFFDEIITNAYTLCGEAVCKSLGMSHITDHVRHGKIYIMKLYPIPNLPIFKEHPKLIEMYRGEAETILQNTYPRTT